MNRQTLNKSVQLFSITKRAVLICLCLVCLSGNVFAQHKKEKVQSPPRPSLSELVANYQFAEALELLEEEIEILEEKGKDISQLTAQEEQVERCLQMLSATEDICFIDSIVLHKSQMLSALPLSSEIGHIGTLQQVCPEVARQCDSADVMSAYMNSMEDCLYFTMKDSVGVEKLHSCNNLMGTWTSPTPLDGITNISGKQGYPFMLSDGITFYYSAQHPDGIGGYDIYVTRYQSSENRFLTPELLNMPFNSLANDYFYIYDEGKEIGCFATDRRQAADSVCVYFFLPNPERRIYQADSLDEAELRGYAQIRFIKDTWSNAEEVALAKAELYKADVQSSQNMYRFIINDAIVYTQLEQFKSASARRIAEQWIQESERLATMQSELELLRNSYTKGASQQEQEKILQYESAIHQLRATVLRLEKNMRNTELAQ